MTRFDFQSRVDAIIECDVEPSEQIWTRLSLGSTREELSHEFGYSLNYLDRLTAEAVERRLLAGVRYGELKKILGESEKRCWSILLSLRLGYGSIHNVCVQAAALRAQAIELHRNGATRAQIARHLELSTTTVRRVLILGMLDDSAIHRLQRILGYQRTRTNGYRWERASSKKTGQKTKKAQVNFERSSSPLPILNSQEAGRLRRRALRLHREAHSLKEIQSSLGVGQRTSNALLAVALVESGWTLEAAGTLVGLSRERVRQIARQSGVNVRELKKSRLIAKESNFAHRQSLIRNWVKSHPGCTTCEIAAGLQLDELETRAIPRSVVHLVLDSRSLNTWTKSRHSKGAILAAIRQAFEIRNPHNSMYSEGTRLQVSGPFYDKLRRSGEVDGPSAVRIIQVFGSWSAACEMAGVPSPPSLRAEYSRRWTDEELVEYLAAFLTVTTATGIDKFDMWCREDEARPSSGTVRNQLGLSWSDAKDAALLKLRSQWTKKPPTLSQG